MSNYQKYLEILNKSSNNSIANSSTISTHQISTQEDVKVAPQ